MYLLTVKQKETLHLLTLGYPVTQNKVVTRILFIFHKFLIMPTIPAEWPIYLEMMKEQPVFVSSIIHVVLHTLYSYVVSSYMYQVEHDILIGFSELSQGSVSLSGCKSPNSAFTLSWWITLSFL